jgi:cold shock CspA family protein
MSGQYLGTIRFWNSEKRFGFATTDDGQEFYIGAAGLTGRANIEGTRIQFDRATKRPDASWTQMLNDGALRDADGIDPRNPRPPRRTWTGAAKKPVAVNVVVIDPSDPGGRSCTGPDPVSEPGI